MSKFDLVLSGKIVFYYLSVSFTILFSDMQLFDGMGPFGVTINNVPLFRAIRIHDHDEILTPGRLVLSLHAFLFIHLLFLGLSFDDIVHVFNALEWFVSLPAYHGDVPALHDVPTNFVSILSLSYFRFFEFSVFPACKFYFSMHVLVALFVCWLVCREQDSSIIRPIVLII